MYGRLEGLWIVCWGRYGYFGRASCRYGRSRYYTDKRQFREWNKKHRRFFCGSRLETEVRGEGAPFFCFVFNSFPMVGFVLEDTGQREDIVRMSC